MRTELRAALAAVAFLTRVPVPAELDGSDVRRAGAYFPLVGAALGAVTGLVALGLSHIVPSLLAAVLAVTVLALLTGALHFDALADTADAAGGTTRERALEIMRDHTIGTYGALALLLDVVVRVVAIGSLLDQGHVVADLAAAGAVSRAVPVAIASVLPYARASGGIGAPFALGSRARAAVAVVLGLAIAATVAGVTGVELALGAAAAGLVAAVVSRRWLGGVTGDTLGASAELAELTALVVAVAV
jgi:adenosylcobinamide-GDP ribazoletransferase